MGVPTVSASSSISTDHSYQSSLSNSPTLIFAGRGNLFGFWLEENGSQDLHIQFFDAASAGAVTVGITTPAFTFRLPADAGFGKDVNDSPVHFFSKGCVVAITTTRTGSTAPASPATGQFWYYNSKY